MFAEFDEKPIAAASLGQVHLARLSSGERVVVKVQRPGLKDLFDIDLKNIRCVIVCVTVCGGGGGNAGRTAHGCCEGRWDAGGERGGGGKGVRERDTGGVTPHVAKEEQVVAKCGARSTREESVL